jgi:hypothetical protein
MPEFELQRQDYLPSGIFGDLSNGMYTLEHSFDNKPKIPAGVGIWARYASPKFGFDVFRCQSVDGVEMAEREFEIHIGNYNNDSDGCILIGKSIGNMLNGGKMLCKSEATFLEFMESLAGIDTITITIIDLGI